MRSSRISESSPPRSWLAVRGKSPEAVRTALRLRESSLAGDDKLTFQIVGGSSDAGWYLIVARGRDHRLLAEPLIGPLSVGCEVLTCTVEEQESISGAAAWRNGVREWSVSYTGTEGPADVIVDGTLPFAAAVIRDQRIAKARAEDAGDALVDPMFEIPVEIVHSVIGYKPYQANSAFVNRFKLLEGLDTPWYTRWVFGG